MRPAQLMFALVALGSLTAEATVVYQENLGMPSFIWTSRYLTSGTPVTIDTRNLTGTSPDTVMHVLFKNSSGVWSQVAWNDDSTGLASSVTFTPATTGGYYVWVRSYSTSSAGKADLYQNGSLILSQAPFGGVRIDTAWAQNDIFAVTGVTNTTPNDFMLFLLPSNSTYLQHDDDSGANYYPYATANAAESGGSRFISGAYPGSSGPSRITMDHNPCQVGQNGYSCPYDADIDGISDALETAAQMDSTLADTDADGLGDYAEFYGTDGFSYSEYSHVYEPDVFIELDYLANPPNPANARIPYSGLPGYVASIFGADAYGYNGVHANIFIDGALTWHQFVAFDEAGQTCAVGDDCVKFTDLKNANFSPSDASRRSGFHYAVWGYQQQNLANCSSGIALLPGQDLFIAMGCTTNSPLEQRGTFIHEFGHNLNLDHYGSGNNNGNNSVVFASVMNYRYQFTGVDINNRDTYSHGVNACASCTTSPKQACIDCRAVGACGLSFCTGCDCDRDDWGMTNLDFPGMGSGSGSPGAGLDKWADVAHAAAVHHPTFRGEDEIAARELAAIDHLRKRGLREGVDFILSANGRHASAICP